MHVRSQIAFALVTRLTGLVTTGANVFLARVETVTQATLPALAIKVGPEQRDPDLEDITGRSQPRLLSVSIEGHVNDGSTYTLDQIAAEVEVALETEPTLGGLVRNLKLEQTELLYNADGDRDFMAIVMTYSLVYSTLRTDPHTLA